MSIAEMREKCKGLLASVPKDVLIIAILVLVSSLSFGLGYLAGKDAGQESTVTVIPMPSPPVSDSAAPTPTPGRDVGASASGVVASKNGTKYYLPSCSGADRISAGNKVWFASPAAAAAAGYAPAANCKGI